MPELFQKDRKLNIVEYGRQSQVPFKWSAIRLDFMSLFRRFWRG